MVHDTKIRKLLNRIACAITMGGGPVPAFVLFRLLRRGPEFAFFIFERGYPLDCKIGIIAGLKALRCLRRKHSECSCQRTPLLVPSLPYFFGSSRYVACKSSNVLAKKAGEPSSAKGHGLL